ncbi:hypothetical protein Zmor_020977 [Zophobas morio]|uniref:Uncharacterized protein n=1 Tax=Zophobas morio TaxID=2755281 RepID=A0AA38MAP3_9CUCU|nr:hypothetical protein Zmor_020977 [Zophobas morio]
MHTLHQVFLTVVAVFFLIGSLGAHPGAFLDETDICILICDKCFKNQALLNCANHCLATSGQVSSSWKQKCPYFSSNQPAVKYI